MINFKIGNLQVSLEFGFFAVTALFCLLDAPEIAFSAICACIIHECGHIITSLLCSVKIEKVTLWAGGIRMQTESKMLKISNDVLILLSGPIFNFISAFLYYISDCYAPFSVNLILGLFNLLPFTSLDGGALIKKILDYYNIQSGVIMKITAFLAAFIVILFFYFTGTGNFTGYLTIIFLAVFEFFY